MMNPIDRELEQWEPRRERKNSENERERRRSDDEEKSMPKLQKDEFESGLRTLVPIRNLIQN